ncbi:YetF domain-containing protein [Bacillus sp. FSL K6-3431]|uniref:YetF domain-containing protein n=1 Tax=Bacillus sp. FSL K6-3431 TaxID=2921500 RepID=UPI0030F6B35B
MNVSNIKTLKLTVDKLEERLRQIGITSINDVLTATIGTNGKLRYTFKKEKQPVTKKEPSNPPPKYLQ